MLPVERIMAVFEGKRSDKIVWQPRIDHWYDANKKLGTLPAEYRLSLVSKKELVDFTNAILSLFSPKIILGISDMLPPNGDIERVRTVGEIAEGYVP